MTPFPGAAASETFAATGATVGGPAGAARGSGPLEPGAPFGVRYRILRELGAGGMGVVYQAWDDALGVAVALKVIRPEVTADPYVAQDVERRFKRELLLARQVTHKNVVRIHDLGEVDGIKYLTMPFIDGRDLASVLREAGTLPAGRALHVARQIAAGLQAAHEAGVVHRDLKPENVMLDADDQAQIMDFGISRSVGTGSTMTAHGAVVGTLEYMAPEQGRGQAVDHRADIYAFGLMLRDMLVGRTRLAASESAIAEMMNRMTHPLPPMREQQPGISAELEAIVARCTNPEIDGRFATTAELVAALESLDGTGHARRPAAPPRTASARLPWLLGAVAVAALVVAGMLWWNGRPSAPPPAREPVTVLIADFHNQTGDSVFQGSLEQALGIAVEGAGFISSYPRSEALRTLEAVRPGSTLDESGAKIVAASAGIPVILAGAIAPGGSGYTVSLRAVEARPEGDRVIVQKEVRAASKADVLGAVGTLAAAIRSGLGDTEEIAPDAPETFTAGSIDAMRAYVRGQELNAAGKPREALAAFERAVQFDPGFGRAYANMASIYTNLKMDDQAKQYYQLAIRNMDRMTDREKYRTRGIYYLGVERDYEQAVSNYQRLIEEYPADNNGYANLALAHLYLREIRKAVEVGRTSIEVYPKNVLQRTNYATYSMYAGDFDTAVAQADMVLAANPSYEFAHLTRALSLLAQGRTDEARAGYATLAAVSDLGRSLALTGEADLELYFGRNARGVEILTAGIAHDGEKKLGANRALKMVALAEAHLAFGEVTSAVEAATRALALEPHEGVQYPAARVLIAAREGKRAEPIAAAMEKAPQRPTRSYGRLLGAALLLDRGEPQKAIDAIQEALKLHDSWAGHALLAEANMAAGKHVQAADQWELCLARRGEATDAFFADTSTLRYLAPVHYWLARAHEANGSAGSARTSYETFAALRGQADPGDRLALDARQRLLALPR